MLIYDRLAATALKQLKKYGRQAILRQYTGATGDYDPTTGRVTPVVGTSNDALRWILLADQPGQRIDARFGINRESNTLEQKGQKWVYMDANGPKPDLQDHVVVDNTNYSIIDVQEIKPAMTAILYLLVLKT